MYCGMATATLSGVTLSTNFIMNPGNIPMSTEIIAAIIIGITMESGASLIPSYFSPAGRLPKKAL